MFIDKNTDSYSVTSKSSVLRALDAIEKNKSRIIFVVKENGYLLGSVSDGDVRRWLTSSDNANLQDPIESVVNTSCTKCYVTEELFAINTLFSDSINIIPLVDSKNILVAVAKNGNQCFKIRDKLIGPGQPIFTISEIGNNHQGCLDNAKKLIDLSVAAGADCVKFQMRNMQKLYGVNASNGNPNQDLGCQYTLDILNKFQLDDDDLLRLFDYANLKGIIPLCTPWDTESADKLESYGIEAYKIASADLTNSILVNQLISTGKPLICSTGMSTEQEIKQLSDSLKKANAQFALLHCNSTYPTPFKDINLRYINKLFEISGGIVGYSGHERGFTVPLAAVALGAQIIEKHLTLNREQEGPDHKVSLLPDELAVMITEIKNIQLSLGTSKERFISQGEMINRENLSKSIAAAVDIRQGDLVTRDKLIVISPGLGIQPNKMNLLLGTKAKRNILSGELFFQSDISNLAQKKRAYQFSRPYGIPVRYHDCSELIRDLNLDFVEFHLSYKDLSLSPGDFLQNVSVKNFTIHAPELFPNDHILDLASADEYYRRQSIKYLQKVLEVTHEIQQLIPHREDPVLVLNAGGWTTDDFISLPDREVGYKRVFNSLSQLDHANVRIAIQTMPPFPWHKGGQSFHNLFVDPDEIIRFCDTTGLKICLDISHSHMACVHYGWSFENFLRDVLPYTIHLHISDALGVDGEGVRMGQGDIDFFHLASLLDQFAPSIQFIPEIWQGHKDKGQGFWEALSFLESHKF